LARLQSQPLCPGRMTSSCEIHHRGAELLQVARRLGRPSSDMPAKRPLPENVAILLRGRDPSRYLRSTLRVLHPLDGFRRFAGRRLVASYCRTWGSPRFRLHRKPGPCPKTGRNGCKHRFRVSRELPRDANHTLRRIPLPNSRTVSPQPLPACRFNDFQALLRRKVRDVEPPLPAVDTLSFHGLRSPSRSFALRKRLLCFAFDDVPAGKPS